MGVCVRIAPYFPGPSAVTFVHMPFCSFANLRKGCLRRRNSAGTLCASICTQSDKGLALRKIVLLNLLIQKYIQRARIQRLGQIIAHTCWFRDSQFQGVFNCGACWHQDLGFCAVDSCRRRLTRGETTLKVFDFLADGKAIWLARVIADGGADVAVCAGTEAAGVAMV